MMNDGSHPPKLSRKFGIERRWTVYILECRDSSHYVGCTSNIERRLENHNDKQVHYTKTRLPVNVITTISFTDKLKAYQFEKYLKSGSGRAFFRKRLV